MMKKILSFICCLMPFGAGAATIVENPGAGQSFTAEQLDATNDTYVIESGRGMAIGSGGITVTNDMYIGRDNPSGVSDGFVYVETGAENPFTIRSDGDISIGGTLNVATGRSLGIGAQTVGGEIANATFGQIDALGALVIENIKTFNSGTIDSADNLSITADTITAGAITSTAGNTVLNTTGALTMDQLVASGNAQTTVNAASIQSGSIQNQSGTMNITLAGNLNSTGSIENSGTSMTIGRAGDTDVVNVVVAGTMKNDSNDSTMTLNIDSLRVSGGDATNPSFVNKGNLNATVKGETYLEYGFDLSAMKQDNTFFLDTGTLVFGDNVDQDAWLQVFSNSLNSFSLAIRQGDISVGDIINGTDNVNANMNLMAQAITADSVENRGEDLIMNATNSSGTGIKITGAVTGAANSNTEIVSAADLVVGGNLANSGTMSLNGTQVSLANVSNNGESLEIVAPTDTTGSIDISGAFSNSNGTALINAREITIGGILTNSGGITTIRGSDTAGSNVTIGGINVEGGTLNLNALVGGVNVGNSLTVTTGGAFNVDGTTYALTVGDSILIGGNFTASGTQATSGGDMNVAVSGTRGFVMTSTNGAITIDGDVSATDAAVARSATFDAATIDVGGDVNAGGKGILVFGGNTSQKLTVDGAVSAGAGGTIEIYSDDADVGSLAGAGKFIVHGTQITANNGDINIENGVWFDGTDHTSGMVVRDTNTLTLKTVASNADISLAGGVTIGANNTLALDSANAVSVSGIVSANGNLDIDAKTSVIFDNAITNNATLTVNAQSINAQDIKNTATTELIASTGEVSVGNITNSNDLKISGDAIVARAIDSTAGVLDITGRSVNVDYMTITGGTANIASANITATNDISVSGDLMQGGATTGMLNLTQDGTVLNAANLTIGGAFNANAFTAEYNVSNNVAITGNINVATGANATIDAQGKISAADVANNGTLSLSGNDGITLGVVANNGGTLSLLSGDGFAQIASFTMNGGTANLSGRGMNSTGAFTTGGILYQNYGGALAANDVNVLSDYAITASNVNVAGIIQDSGALVLNTSDITVGGDISATDLRIAANPATDWLTVDVTGNVTGAAQFIGLEHMTVGGNYSFDNGSILRAAILPYAAGVGPNTTTQNYWSTISLNDDNTLGTITNAADGEALISVNGKFVSNITGFGTGANGGALQDNQIGIDLFDIVDQGTAIWFLHAEDGVEDLASKIRNLNVNFCNADGSICFNYLDSLDKNYGSDDDLPAYLSVRDSDGDGIPDSLYIVFDPRFGGPVEVFKIQPIVERTDNHTTGEYVSAGAIDNLIAGQLQNTGFFNSTPIEVIPVMFKGTNLETMAQELYDRMEYYNLQRDGEGLARFSRLFQAREIEQIAGSVALNEHTNFRSFEDRMFDEFIWNRNRNLKKAWADFDFGMFTQDVSDNKRVDGNRFNISGGFDWQETETMIVGLTGRISHMSSDNFDTMDLGYLPGQHIAGHVDMKVADTNIGLGGYLMKTLGEKTRVYGNAFLDMHVFDISRNQNYVAPIDGSGTAFSLISEWGLLHDWLNQYIVGNMYARVGYNFGFSVKEKAAGQDYMNLKSDGYLILTPGYSLTAQKRIYPSVWFQIRPYATIGIEYDVLGAPDSAKYKFAPAHTFTSYDIDIDPLWANIGGGVELLSATGIQVGLDYRYQYNNAIQLHNIKISGSYRF